MYRMPYVVSYIAEQKIIYLEGAAWHRIAAAAPSDKGIDIIKLDVVLLYEVSDNFHPVIKLIVGCRK
jgi:hypothetical protein